MALKGIKVEDRIQVRQRVKAEQWKLVIDKEKYHTKANEVNALALEEHLKATEAPFSTRPEDQARLVITFGID